MVIPLVSGFPGILFPSIFMYTIYSLCNIVIALSAFFYSTQSQMFIFICIYIYILAGCHIPLVMYPFRNPVTFTFFSLPYTQIIYIHHNLIKKMSRLFLPSIFPFTTMLLYLHLLHSLVFMKQLRLLY